MINSNILIIEDDQYINKLLSKILKEYNVTCAFSGSEVKLLVSQNNYDLILLDLMLPGLTGENFIQDLRETKTMPIIVISAKDSLDSKVNVLKLGADDFIGKPFQVEEVFARVQSQLRRYTRFSKPEEKILIVTFKDIFLNKEFHNVTLKGELVSLTNREFSILELLMTYPKKVYTKENLFKTVWQEECYVEDNTVNVHVSNIRGKLFKIDPKTEYIKTIWGIGFKMGE